MWCFVFMGLYIYECGCRLRRVDQTYWVLSATWFDCHLFTCCSASTPQPHSDNKIIDTQLGASTFTSASMIFIIFHLRHHDVLEWCDCVLKCGCCRPYLILITLPVASVSIASFHPSVHDNIHTQHCVCVSVIVVPHFPQSTTEGGVVRFRQFSTIFLSISVFSESLLFWFATNASI